MTDFDAYGQKPNLEPQAPLARMVAGLPVKGETDVGQVEDIGKGFAGGVGRGTAGLAGMGGSAGNLLRSGLSAAGVSDQTLDRGAAAAKTLGYVNPLARWLTGPDTEQTTKGIESVTGKFYEPKTLAGQYASTGGEFLPGMLLPGTGGVGTAKQIGAKALNWLAPTITSETAGQITKDTPLEPYARGVGGVVGGVGAAKLVTPVAPADRAYQDAVKLLEKENIPLTAGQRTGSKPLQWAESTAADMPGSSTRARELYGEGKTAYDRSVTERLYDRNELTARGVPPEVNLPDAQVAKAGPKSLSDEYTRLHANDLVSNPQLMTRMGNAQSEYERLVLPNERTSKIADTFNDVVDKLVAGKGRMAGDEYQAIRSQLEKAAKAATNPKEAAALREMKNSLDEAFNTGLPPRDKVALALNNQRWGNMKTVEDAVASAATQGNLSPARVAQAVRAGRGGQYAAQGGNLDELTQAAARVMKDLPQSGTGPRTQMQTMMSFPSLLSAGSGGVLGGLVGGPLGAVAGAVMPMAAARAVVSGGGQKYLGNRVLPQNTRDVVAQTLAEQAGSQPSGIERNQREQDEYEKKRLRLTVHPGPQNFR